MSNVSLLCSTSLVGFLLLAGVSHGAESMTTSGSTQALDVTDVESTARANEVFDQIATREKQRIRRETDSREAFQREAAKYKVVAERFASYGTEGASGFAREARRAATNLTYRKELLTNAERGDFLSRAILEGAQTLYPQSWASAKAASTPRSLQLEEELRRLRARRLELSAQSADIARQITEVDRAISSAQEELFR